MNEPTNRVRVTIFGEEYTLRGADTTDGIKSIARLVDQVMRKISSTNPGLTQNRVAVLAAVNLADELTKLRKDYKNLESLLDDITRTSSPQPVHDERETSR